MAKIFENARHRIYREGGAGVFESLLNGSFGLKDPVRYRIQDKRTGKSGTGVGRDRREAERRAWQDLRSRNEA